MTEPKTPTWNDVRRIADELKLKLHLAGMEARRKWEDLQPSLVEAETELARGGTIVAAKLTALGASLKEIGDDFVDRLDRVTHETPK